MLLTPTKARAFSVTVISSFVLLAMSGALVFARWNLVHTRSIQPVAPSHTLQADDRLEVELVTLRPRGFEPNEITRAKGSFVLFVEDRSGKSDSSLRLQRLSGERLRDVNTSRMKSEWHDVINLPAGEYLLTDDSQPEAQCRIIILP